MAEFITNFIPGFEDVVARHIPRELGGAELISVSGGMARFNYTGKPSFVAALPFLNNSFAVIRAFGAKRLTFAEMAGAAARKPFRPIGEIKSFRVRFSRENRFEKVPQSVVLAAEGFIEHYCGARADRLRPDCEFWFIIRRGGQGFFAQRLKKKAPAGGLRALNQGELRPELACLLCLDCQMDGNSIVCDPFAGYGSIPLNIQNCRDYKRLYVSDGDARIADYLKKTGLGRDPRAVVRLADATYLTHIGDGEVDYIVTDPPWGLVGRYGDVAGLYVRSFAEMRRIIKGSGKIVVLTGRPDLAAEAARSARFAEVSRADILVNGKKAAALTYAPGWAHAAVN